AKGLGGDPGAPYARGGNPNHLEQYDKAIRNATKVRHALDHCFQMARWAHAEKRWALAMDWMVAAISLIMAEGEDLRSFEELLFQLLWVNSSPAEKKNWGQLKTNDPSLLEARVIGATFT